MRPPTRFHRSGPRAQAAHNPLFSSRPEAGYLCPQPVPGVQFMPLYPPWSLPQASASV
jgi:hypothetical protein